MKYVDGGTAEVRRPLNILKSAAVGLLLAAGACGTAFAQSTPSTQQTTPNTQQTAPGQPAKQDPGDKVICRYVDPDTGSRLNSTHKVCHTKREWDQMNKDAGDMINTMGRDAGQRPQ